MTPLRTYIFVDFWNLQPAVEFLLKKGLQVINAYFPPTGMDLARTCWGNFDVRPHLNALSR
jgi:hypothetical protein